MNAGPIALLAPAALGALAHASQTVANQTGSFYDALTDALSDRHQASSQPPASDPLLVPGGRLPIRTEPLSNFDTSLARFQAQVLQRLNGVGVDTSVPIELELRSLDGTLVVQGDHPDRAKIQQLLDSNPDLAAGARELATLASSPVRRIVIDALAIQNSQRQFGPMR